MPFGYTHRATITPKILPWSAGVEPCQVSTDDARWPMQEMPREDLGAGFCSFIPTINSLAYGLVGLEPS